MPNGHGGAPLFGGPIILAVMFGIAVTLPLQASLGWAWVAVCVALAAAVGWRLAYHLHMRDADEYGGAYGTPEEYQRALRRYRMLALVYAVAAAAVGFGIVWWRGLP
jgi:hypothetical protein